MQTAEREETITKQPAGSHYSAVANLHNVSASVVRAEVARLVKTGIPPMQALDQLRESTTFGKFTPAAYPKGLPRATRRAQEANQWRANNRWLKMKRRAAKVIQNYIPKEEPED
jgi:hypothetical protein